MNISQLAQAAKKASIQLAATSTDAKNNALQHIAKKLKEREAEIIAANTKDMERSSTENLEAPLLKRLKFDSEKIDGVIAGIHSLIALPEPVGSTLCSTELDSGLELYNVLKKAGFSF
jgi:glutamate-5-semialdehyde dehydrogenase